MIDVINLQKQKPPLRWHAATEKAAQMLQAEFEAALKHTSGHAPPVTGEIVVPEPTSVADLARLLGQKPFKVIADLMEVGVFANVNQFLSFETVCQVARKYGYAARKQV